MKISNVKITSGIDLFEEADSRDLLQKARFFASSGILDNTKLQNDILSLTENRGAYMAGNWSETLEKIKVILKMLKIEVLGQQSLWMPVSIYRAYCPDVENAKVRIECSNTNSFTGDTCVEVLGIGGGSTFNIEFKTALEAVAQNKSFEVIYEFESLWEHVKLIEPGGNATELCRLRKINKKHSRASTHILEPMWPEIADDQIVEIKEFNPDKDIPVTTKLSVKSGSQLKVSSKFKLEKFGLEAGTEITTANQFDINYEYTLPGGKHYKAIRPKDASYWLWTVE